MGVKHCVLGVMLRRKLNTWLLFHERSELNPHFTPKSKIHLFYQRTRGKGTPFCANHQIISKLSIKIGAKIILFSLSYPSVHRTQITRNVLIFSNLYIKFAVIL